MALPGTASEKRYCIILARANKIQFLRDFLILAQIMFVIGQQRCKSITMLSTTLLGFCPHLRISRRKKTMRLFLPLLLLADARVEGGREEDSSYGFQVDKQERGQGIPGAPQVQVKGEKIQIKKETQSTNCSELLNSFSESSSSFTRWFGAIF